MTHVYWIEPDENELPIMKMLSREAAIFRQKEVASMMGFTYSDDEEALLDFVTVNWAWLGIPSQKLES